jgi:hypothetical protein
VACLQHIVGAISSHDQKLQENLWGSSQDLVDVNKKTRPVVLRHCIDIRDDKKHSTDYKTSRLLILLLYPSTIYHAVTESIDCGAGLDCFVGVLCPS